MSNYEEERERVREVEAYRRELIAGFKNGTIRPDATGRYRISAWQTKANRTSSLGSDVEKARKIYEKRVELDRAAGLYDPKNPIYREMSKNINKLEIDATETFWRLWPEQKKIEEQRLKMIEKSLQNPNPTKEQIAKRKRIIDQWKFKEAKIKPDDDEGFYRREKRRLIQSMELDKAAKIYNPKEYRAGVKTINEITSTIRTIRENNHFVNENNRLIRQINIKEADFEVENKPEGFIPLREAEIKLAANDIWRCSSIDEDITYDIVKGAFEKIDDIRITKPKGRIKFVFGADSVKNPEDPFLRDLNLVTFLRYDKSGAQYKRDVKADTNKNAFIKRTYPMIALRNGSDISDWQRAIFRCCQSIGESFHAPEGHETDKEAKGRNYEWRLKAIRVILNPTVIAKGGCSTTKSNKGETASFRIPGEGLLKLHAPADREKYSKGNNCAILAIKHYLKNVANLKVKFPDAEFIRSQAMIEEGALINSEDEMEALRDVFENLSGRGINIQVEHVDQIVKSKKMARNNPANIARISRFVSDMEDPITVELAHMNVGYEHGGHYFAIIERTGANRCERCGTNYDSQHSCNPRKVEYYRKHILKAKNIMTFNSALIHDKPYPLENIYVYDFETFFPNGELNAAFKIYAAGMMRLGLDLKQHPFPYQHQYGENAIDLVCNLIEFKIKSKQPAVLVAHNGSGFDSLFIVNEMTKRGLSPDADGYLKSGSNLLVCRWGKVQLWDTYRVLSQSLGTLAEEFKLSEEEQKLDFDHNKIKSFEDADLYKKEVLPYLEADVKALAGVFKAHNDAVFDRWGVHAVEHLTGASMAFKLLAKSITEQMIDIYSPTPVEAKKIRKSIYGGRVTPWMRTWENQEIVDKMSKLTEEQSIVRNLKKQIESQKSSIKILKKIIKKDSDAMKFGKQKFDRLVEMVLDLSALNKKYNDARAPFRKLYEELKASKDYLIAADITSLYPFAQSDVNVAGLAEGVRAYPCGKAVHVSDAQSAEDAFNKGTPGFYHIKFIPPRDLNWPILARKMDNKIVWSLEPGEGTYTHIEIEDAIKEGYYVDFGTDDRDDLAAVIYPTKYSKVRQRRSGMYRYEYVMDDFGSFINPFAEIVKDLLELKKEATVLGHKAKRAIAKILVNSIWGSCCYVAPNLKSTIIRDAMSFLKWNENHDLHEWSELYRGAYHVSGFEIDPETLEPHENLNEKRCPHLGAYVLSHSRRIMTNAVRIANGGTLHGNYWCVSYTDTDSLYVNGAGHERLCQAGLWSREKDDLGHFDNDLKDNGKEPLIFEFHSTGPKSKMVNYLTAEGNFGDEITLKGLPLEGKVAALRPLTCQTDSAVDVSNVLKDRDTFKQMIFKDRLQVQFEFNSFKKQYPTGKQRMLKVGSEGSETAVAPYSITNCVATRSTNISLWKGFNEISSAILRPHGFMLKKY